ncbi:hypothetical protein GNI_144140, partial [Gregarina niphandrodes]
MATDSRTHHHSGHPGHPGHDHPGHPGHDHPGHDHPGHDHPGKTVVGFQGSSYNLPRLKDHNIDVRCRTKTFVLDSPALSWCATNGTAMTKKNPARVQVLKAGTMRLVLELVDDEGVPVPNQSVSELALLRVSLPMVDVDLLKELYTSTFRTLTQAPPDEYPTIAVDQSCICLPKPLVPWEPTLFRIRIRNCCTHGLPASFSLNCLSDSG